MFGKKLYRTEARAEGEPPSPTPGLWQRMEQSSNGKGPPEWLSTHPSEGTREQDIRGWIAEARQYYQPPPAPDAPLPSINGSSSSGSSGSAGDNEPKFRPR